MQISFDIVAVFGNNVERCFDIVASVDRALLNSLALTDDGRVHSERDGDQCEARCVAPLFDVELPARNLCTPLVTDARCVNVRSV